MKLARSTGYRVKRREDKAPRRSALERGWTARALAPAGHKPTEPPPLPNCPVFLKDITLFLGKENVV